MRPRTAVGRQGGFAYIALLIVVAAMGAGLAALGTVWHSVQQRDKERELLFVGEQYRRAIERYYLATPGAGKYPASLEALLQDERSPAIRRHLRKPYRDPLTNAREWGIVNAPEGGIMGVYSLSRETPLKRAHFPLSLGWDDGKASYAEWQFVYRPQPAVQR